MTAVMRNRLSHAFVEVENPLHVIFFEILAKRHSAPEHLVVHMKIKYSDCRQRKCSCGNYQNGNVDINL